MWLTREEVDRIVETIQDLQLDMRRERRKLFYLMLPQMEGIGWHNLDVGQIESDVLGLIENHTVRGECGMAIYLRNAMSLANNRGLNKQLESLRGLVKMVENQHAAHQQALSSGPPAEEAPDDALLYQRIFVPRPAGHDRPLVNYDRFRDDLQSIFRRDRPVLWMPDVLSSGVSSDVTSILRDLAASIARSQSWIVEESHWGPHMTPSDLMTDMNEGGAGHPGEMSPEWYAGQIVDRFRGRGRHALLIFLGFGNAASPRVLATVSGITRRVCRSFDPDSRHVGVLLLGCQLVDLRGWLPKDEIQRTPEGPRNPSLLLEQLRGCVQQFNYPPGAERPAVDDLVQLESIQQINEELVRRHAAAIGQ